MNKKWWARPCATLALFLLAACSPHDLLGTIASGEEQATARDYIDRLRRREFEAIEPSLDKSVFGPEPRTLLQQMAAAVPAEAAKSVKLVGAFKQATPGSQRLNLTFEYEFERTWLLANVATEERAGAKSIIGLNVYPRTRSLEAENRFVLAGKPAAHYAVLAAGAVSLLMSVGALVACVRTRVLRRRWAWGLFSLVGVSQFALNWTTGQWRINVISVHLPAAGAFAPPYSPWIVTVSLPLGALAALVACWRARRARTSSAAGLP